jgi:hypothetical protein
METEHKMKLVIGSSEVSRKRIVKISLEQREDKVLVLIDGYYVLGIYENGAIKRIANVPTDTGFLVHNGKIVIE